MLIIYVVTLYPFRNTYQYNQIQQLLPYKPRAGLLLRTSPKGMSETPWAQGGPRSDTWDLWRRWLEGPSDPTVGEDPGHWKRLPPTWTRSHKGKAMSYA
jgi:hypothetical protein